MTTEACSPEQRQLTVYYDGACPLCRREIDFYRRRSGGDSVAWVDAAAFEDHLISPDLTRADALARFHVRLPNGTLESGARVSASCGLPYSISAGSDGCPGFGLSKLPPWDPNASRPLGRLVLRPLNGNE